MIIQQFLKGFSLDCRDFGNIDKEMIKRTLSFVSKTLGGYSQHTVYSEILIMRSPFNHPRISSVENNGRIIYLDCSGSDDFQWIYQFSHEYCHFLINGDFSGEKRGLWWFEESVCCLASMFCLAFYDGCLSSVGIPEMPSEEYLRAQLESLKHLTLQFRNYGGSVQWLPFLLQSGEEYNPAQYDCFSALAAEMLPYFQDNPNLWRILRSMNKAKDYSLLSAFADKLLWDSDYSYLSSLQSLLSYILPRLI